MPLRPPSEKERIELLQIASGSLPLADDVELEQVKTRASEYVYVQEDECIVGS